MDAPREIGPLICDLQAGLADVPPIFWGAAVRSGSLGELRGEAQVTEIGTIGPLTDQPIYDTGSGRLALGLDAFQVRVFTA